MGKYDHLFYEYPKEETHRGGFMTPYQAYFRSSQSVEGAQLYLPYRAFLKPGVIDAEPHMHRDEEYLAFVGHDTRDAFESFDAEIELWMGKSVAEMEKITITKPTMVRVPPFTWHGPIVIKRLGKPLFFQPLLFNTRYYAVRQVWDEATKTTTFPTLVEGMTPCKLDRSKRCDFCGKCRGDTYMPYVDFSESYGSTNTGAYDEMIHVFKKDPTKWGDFMPPYQAYFRGTDCMPNATLYTCYRPYMKDIFLDREANFHTEEEYLSFVGYDMTDPWGSFDAEIEFWIGKDLHDMERHVFTRPFIVRIPPYTWHCPLQFKNLKKPVYLQVLGTRGQFGVFMPDKEEDGRHGIRYSGAVGNKMCIYEPTKRCNVCGRCIMAAKKNEDLPDNATDMAKTYDGIDL